MTDDQKKLPPDEEYQFPQEEYVMQDAAATDDTATAHAGDTASSPKSPFGVIKDRLSYLKFLKNKRILVVVLIVIAVIIILRIVDANKAPAPLPTVQSQPVAQPVIQPNDDAMLGSLDSLKAYNARAESQIHDLRTQIASVQESVSQTQTETQQLRDSIKTLADQMQILTQRLNELVVKKIPEGVRITYHLRAVLPDRAWITSNTGETQSVTIGDHITQYGTVRSINVGQGIVETSSGRKIHYGPNDH